jgi:hypothetical protein
MESGLNVWVGDQSELSDYYQGDREKYLYLVEEMKR